MSIFDRMFRREGLPQTGSSGASSNTTQKGGSYEDRTVRVTSADAALKISAYYRGLELRARTMSQLVWQYQRKDKEGGNYVTDNYGVNGRLNYMLQVRPNPLMTNVELQKQLQIQILQQGNGVVYIERDTNGIPIALWLCSTAFFVIETGNYDLTYMRPGQVTAHVIAPASDVLHLPNTFCYGTQYMTGRSTLEFMRDVLSLDATNIKLMTESAAKGGRVKLLVQEDKTPTFGMPGRASQTQLKKITDQLNDDIYNNDVVMLNNVAGVTPISMTATEMDILNSRKSSLEDVSRFLSVPKILLGDGSNASYKSPEAAMQEFLLFAIQPDILALEAELNSKLLGVDDFGKRRIHVCDKNLRRLDPAGQADVFRKRFEMAAMTINDIRQTYDMPSIEGGDIPYITAQVAEVGSEKLRKNGLDNNPTAIGTQTGGETPQEGGAK